MGVSGMRMAFALPWSSSTVHDTVPSFTLHWIVPPTPDTRTLHFLNVPGRKSLLDTVRHLDEQLLMAICFESESKAVVPWKLAANMQVTNNSLMILAILLL
jgi:hypothetical protein